MSSSLPRLALAALACTVALPAAAQVTVKEISYPVALTIATAALDDCKARGYATSPEYAEAKKARQGAGTMDMTIVEGI